MSDVQIRDELADQYGRAWGMFRTAVERFSPEQWRSAPVGSLVPARHAYHVLESADFYCGSAPPKEFPWGRRFGGLWDTMPLGRLPSQEQVLAYLGEVRAKADAWLAGLGDRDLLGPEELFGWTGGTLLGRALYLLRHTQHHVAEMNAELRLRGLAVLDWL